MIAVRWLLAALVSAAVLPAEDSRKFLTPFYSGSSIVNSATNGIGWFSPNAFATIYGANLSASTRAIRAEDIAGGALPTTLGGVRVFVSGLPASLYYVSPEQVNFLIPSSFRPGDVDLWLTRDGTTGPKVRVTLQETAPGLFQMDSAAIVATHADGSLLSAEKPADAGELVILYATGLGRTTPEAIAGRIAYAAAPLQQIAGFRVLLGGEPVEPARVAYAGIAPGFAGLYQINVRLPEQTAANPEIRIAVGDRLSPASLKILLNKGSPAVAAGSVIEAAGR